MQEFLHIIKEFSLDLNKSLKNIECCNPWNECVQFESTKNESIKQVPLCKQKNQNLYITKNTTIKSSNKKIEICQGENYI